MKPLLVLETIRRYGKNTETIDVIYIINDNRELPDDIRIRDFLLSPPQTMVSDLMDYRYISLNAHDEQEMASEVFKMNNRVALPVVDEDKILLGIVTIDDILWVAQEEFTEDIQKLVVRKLCRRLTWILTYLSSYKKEPAGSAYYLSANCLRQP